MGDNAIGPTISYMVAIFMFMIKHKCNSFENVTHNILKKCKSSNVVVMTEYIWHDSDNKIGDDETQKQANCRKQDLCTESKPFIQAEFNG